MVKYAAEYAKISLELSIPVELLIACSLTESAPKNPGDVRSTGGGLCIGCGDAPHDQRRLLPVADQYSVSRDEDPAIDSSLAIRRLQLPFAPAPPI
jgi:hypothetical protein